MRLKLAARQSDLARLQAFRVGHAIQAAHPEIEIEYRFRSSLGDLNQADPLWKMPEKGVFTEDFLQDLQTGATDLVVHSWKDLPTQARTDTEIVATLPRADTRDLLLVRRKDAAGVLSPWTSRVRGATLKVLTSSPRRAHNLRGFLKDHLPFQPGAIEFKDVRGNIQTRVRKLFEQDADALIVAKAAMDRLLTAEEPEFAETRAFLRQALRQADFMVLPLTVNPTAAAQGALAIEISSAREDLRKILAKINCAPTFRAVEKERKILAGYGGGCHQKIGITVLPRAFGEVQYLRGLTDAGEVLDHVELQTPAPSLPHAASEAQIFPRANESAAFFERRERPHGEWAQAEQSRRLWVAREQACPANFKVASDAIVWCAGLKTWRKLAARGVWIHGSAEGLGDQESPRLEALLDESEIAWTKLTHADSDGVAIYDLVERSEAPNLKGRTHFYWSSGSAFRRALELEPAIARGFHACGPGATARALRAALPGAEICIFLDAESWRRAILGV